MQSVVQSMDESVIAVDAEGRVTLMNPAAETLTGWTQAEAVGEPASDVLVLVDETSRTSVDNPLI